MDKHSTQPAALGDIVAKRRQALGLSREALGAAAGGVSSSTIRRIEHGRVRPHPSTVGALIAALDCATNEQRPGEDRGAEEDSDRNGGPAPARAA